MNCNSKLPALLLLGALVLLTSSAVAQTCLTSSDMDQATRSSLEGAARQFFDYAAKGDVYDLKQAAIPSLASNFGGIEGVVIDQKPVYANAQTTVRTSYLLEAPGNAPLARAEFLCGVWATPQFANLVINNLPPGRYGMVIQDVTTPKGPYTLTMILKQEGASWKLAGYYSKPAQIGGHDAQWFLSKAREYKAKAANHVAWFYYLTGWDLSAPVDFMSTPKLDKIAGEMQSARPTDLPSTDHPVTLASTGGHNYQLIYMSALPVGDDLDLLVKYRSPDVSNTQQTFEDNMAVIKGIVAKYPEFRDAFAGVVARATEPSGRDYGTLLAMKDVK